MMLFISFLLLILGISLSAFFSGSETGFYRASRVRLVIEGLDGDWISRYMLKLINLPTLFVATTLIGNNVANYMTSLAIVLGISVIYQGNAGIAEILGPLLMSPLLFVYGELLPKNLYYQAPNRLLRFSAPLLLFFTVLFAPIAAVLWGLALILEKIVGESPEKIRLNLARKEVQEALVEGHEIGILHQTQRSLAQNFFIFAARPVKDVCLPIARVKPIPKSMTKDAILKLARRKRISDIPVYETNRNNLIGHIRVVDLLVDDRPNEPMETPRKLMEINGTELFGEALIQMQINRETLARVVNKKGQTIGILSLDQLTNSLLKGPLHSLQR